MAKHSTINWDTFPKDKRLERVADIFVDRTSTQNIEKRLAKIRSDRLIAAEPTCMIITGETGVGKTTFLKRYRDMHGAEYRDENNNIVRPVFYLSLQARSTPLTTAQQMVSQLVSPTVAKGGLKNLTDLVKHHLLAQRVELVICDEFQHIVKSGGSISTYQAAEWVKEVVKDTRVPFVMAGMPGHDGVAAIIDNNDQLKSLTPFRTAITPFEYDSVVLRDDFRQFLAEVDNKLPFNSFSYLGQPSQRTDQDVMISGISDGIYSITHGYLRPLNLLLREAAEIAIDNDHSRIEVTDLRDAVEELALLSDWCQAPNPFKLMSNIYDESDEDVASAA
ncbi:ATP-binding protein [Sphingorhabdus lacus]|nr:ATP-binding protein [Sphingorhabdus lacus]